MNRCDFAIYDLETGSRKPKRTQILQIACIIIDMRNLTVKENGIFQSLVKPIEDEKLLEELQLDKVEDEALAVNNLKMEQLREAPEIKHVMQNFVNFLGMFNYTKKSDWDSPIRCGFNNNGFDDVILDREFERLGHWNTDRGIPKYFHPSCNIDVYKMMFAWFESMKMDKNSISLDSLRTFFGMSHEGAHNALVDVYDTAEILCRFLKMHRHFMLNGLIAMEGRLKERTICLPKELTSTT